MDQASYFRSHPPRCIAGFTATATELPGVRFDGHGEPHNPVFALACGCGSKQLKVHGYRWTNPDIGRAYLLSPLFAECSQCGKKTDLFDARIHGYDGELGHNPKGQPEGDPVVDDCGRCGKLVSELFARFEYPTDLVGGNFAEFAGREQNLFTWFSLVGHCCACGQTLGFADLECA
jgi:hypothetical protein